MASKKPKHKVKIASNILVNFKKLNYKVLKILEILKAFIAPPLFSWQQLNTIALRHISRHENQQIIIPSFTIVYKSVTLTSNTHTQSPPHNLNVHPSTVVSSGQICIMQSDFFKTFCCWKTVNAIWFFEARVYLPCTSFSMYQVLLWGGACASDQIRRFPLFVRLENEPPAVDIWAPRHLWNTIRHFSEEINTRFSIDHPVKMFDVLIQIFNVFYCYFMANY